MKLALFGIGRVGRELVKQTVDLPEYNYVSVSDRSYTLVKNVGFSKKEMLDIASLKEIPEYGLQLYNSPGIEVLDNIEETFNRKGKPDILIDTSTAQSYHTILEAIENGINVVSSNKVPYSEVHYRDYKKLFQEAKKERKIIDNRTTVSANLGILARVREFARTANGVDKVRGCLSGTMAYISSKINGEYGTPFSAALKEAKEKLYTEQDPRDDLKGTDSARKATIIGRTANIPIELHDINIEKILPEELNNITISEFMERVRMLDEEFNSRVKKSREKGLALRYIADLNFIDRKYQIGFKEISVNDKVAKSTGTDNSVSIYPRSWNGKDMSLEGPGAGIDVTVQGLLAGLYEIHEMFFSRPE